MAMPPPVQDAPLAIERPDLDSATDAYARRFAGAAGEYLLSVQTRILLDLLRPWPGASVLDVGGGHAQCAAPLSRAGYAVSILGTEEAAFERPRRLCGPDIDCFTGDLLDPPFEDQRFDIAISFRIMPHVRDWRRLIAGLCRVARHAVIVDFPTPQSVNALTPLLFRWKKRVEGDTRDYEMMRTREVTRELARHGFASAAGRPQFFFPLVLHRALKRPALSRILETPPAALGLTRAWGSPVILRARRTPAAGGSRTEAPA